MNTYTLSVYEKAMPDSFTLEQKLEAAKKAGFDAVEISIDESDARLARLEIFINGQSASTSFACGPSTKRPCVTAEEKCVCRNFTVWTMENT